MAFSQKVSMDERTQYVREYDEERRKRANRLFSWATGIPPEDDGMNVWANRFGVTWKELLAAGVIGLVALGIYRSSLQPTASTPAIAAPSDADYEVRFYDAQGNEVRLDKWPGSPQPKTDNP